MQLSTFSTFLLVLLFLNTWQVCCEAFEQQKEGQLLDYMCGTILKKTWERCCDRRCGALKQTLGETMSAQKANGFLKRISHEKNSKLGEECCNEGCSIEEVSEYPC